MRLLVVEDDRQVSQALKDVLTKQSFSVDTTATGEDALRLANDVAYDVILLDYVLPGIDGKQVCKILRERGFHTPILMLTVRCETSDKVCALDEGADDYLTKPFSTDELVARVRALLRRSKAFQSDTFQLDDLVIDGKRQRVVRGQREIYLTRKEFGLLEYLMRNQGVVLSRTDIMEHVWDKSADPGSNTIETHMMTLRKKVDEAGKSKLIHTVQGRGYKIEVQ
ncbi:response regulator transcription factor [Candidatus Uhrbacteria bacterium]|nr:MAG: response regulator transcription factor [Candidatus Uhrbacteria bacterium]